MAVVLTVPDGRYHAKCDSCGEVAQPGCEDELLVASFMRLNGWLVLTLDDICPECVERGGRLAIEARGGGCDGVDASHEPL